MCSGFNTRAARLLVAVADGWDLGALTARPTRVWGRSAIATNHGRKSPCRLAHRRQCKACKAGKENPRPHQTLSLRLTRRSERGGGPSILDSTSPQVIRAKILVVHALESLSLEQSCNVRTAPRQPSGIVESNPRVGEVLSEMTFSNFILHQRSQRNDGNQMRHNMAQGGKKG